MIYFKTAIKQKISFNCKDSKTDSVTTKFNIAYGADKNFLFGTGVSIISILLNNKDINFHFHIFTDFLTDEDIESFSKICEQYNTCVSLYTLNIDMLKNLPTNQLWSYAIYFRLVIADYFYGKCDKVLYLDSDIICAGSIDSLIKLDLASIPVAAVIDADEAHSQKMANLFNVKGVAKGYFNSGVMLINTYEWSSRELTQKSMDVFNDEKLKLVLTCYDQDAINIAVNGDWLKLNKVFNHTLNLNDKYKNKNIDSISNAIFVHFIKGTKPWHSWSNGYSETEIFLQAKEQSPWKDTPLLLPKNVKNYKYATKHFRYQGKYFKSLYYYVLYKCLKLK